MGFPPRYQPLLEIAIPLYIYFVTTSCPSSKFQIKRSWHKITDFLVLGGTQCPLIPRQCCHSIFDIMIFMFSRFFRALRSCRRIKTTNNLLKVCLQPIFFLLSYDILPKISTGKQCIETRSFLNFCLISLDKDESIKIAHAIF